MTPIGFQQDVGVKAQAGGWKEFCSIKGRIN